MIQTPMSDDATKAPVEGLSDEAVRAGLTEAEREAAMERRRRVDEVRADDGSNHEAQSNHDDAVRRTIERMHAHRRRHRG